MKRLLLASALCASVLVGFVANPSPAGAIGTNSRWYVPPYVSDNAEHEANTQDGAYYWENRGFNGYTGPTLPRYHNGTACTSPASGEIRICEEPSSTVEQYACALMGHCGSYPSRFVWKNTHTVNGQKRITSAYILIASDLSPENRQTAYRSAFGAALGLNGGSGNYSCIMYSWSTGESDYVGSNLYGWHMSSASGHAWNGSSCQEDINAMSALYPGTGW